MEINRYLESVELTALRSTAFYTSLRPYIHTRLRDDPNIENLRLHEENENNLTIEDRYFFKLDVLFAEIFQNVRTRQFWKESLARERVAQRISCLAIETLDKAYLNELVVLFERLARLLALVKKAFRSDVNVDDLEITLLEFFNPLLFEKRNLAHHTLYLSCPGLDVVEALEPQVKDERTFLEYYARYRSVVEDTIRWYQYTEEALAVMLKDFLDRLHDRLGDGDGYTQPKYLTEKFSVHQNLRSYLRKRHDHKKVFTEL